MNAEKYENVEPVSLGEKQPILRGKGMLLKFIRSICAIFLKVGRFLGDLMQMQDERWRNAGIINDRISLNREEQH